MKTNKIRYSKERYDVLLTLTGWALAIFVSFLYLSEKKAPAIVQQTPKSDHIVESSSRVETLLIEAKVLLSGNQPVQAINRITTLWSVCHANRQDVPEESHRIFAQAVSLLSQASPRRETRPDLARPQEPVYIKPIQESHDFPDEAPKLKPATEEQPKLIIPHPGYPLAKNEKHYTEEPPNFPAPPVHREAGRRPPTFPSSPPPHEDSGRLPAPPSSLPGNDARFPALPKRGPNAGFPPPPHRPGSDSQVSRRDPLDARPGGPPPGYLQELLEK